MNLKSLALISSLVALPFVSNADAKTHFFHSSYGYHSYVNHSYSSQSFSKPSGTSSTGTVSSFSKPSSSTQTTTSSTTTTFSKPSFASSAPQRSTTFSKPNNSIPNTTSKSTGFSFSKPNTTTITASTTAPTDKVSRAITGSQSKAALTAFTNDQQKFKSPPYAAYSTPTAARNSPLWRTYGSSYNTADAYWTARERFAATQPPPPVWVYHSRPSYGSLAAAFLGGILLDDITQPSYAEYAYSMQDNPDFQQWRADMNQQAEQNADLRAKLAVMDQQISQLQEQNAPKDTALPKGVDPAYAIAPSTALMATSHSNGIGAIGWIDVLFLVFLVALVLIVVVLRLRKTARNIT